MSGLANGDAERLLRFVGEAEALAGDEPFTPETLAALGQVVEADWIGFRERDRIGKRQLREVSRSPGEEPEVELDEELRWRLLNANPPYLLRRQGVVGALRLSDCVTRRQLHRLPIYQLLFRPVGAEYTLNLVLHSPPGLSRAFLLDRFHRDFSERDRLVLDLLRPHLDRIWRNARVRKRLAAALAGLEHASRGDSRGVVLLAAGHRIEFAAPPARRLLDEFFPGETDGRLPRALEDWLEAGGAHPFASRCGRRRLRVERVGEVLLLEERPEPLPLSAREREVLAWVARGKTNAEVARLLWISPGTVRKHLENAFPKLGVRTRTAAATRFLGLIESQNDLLPLERRTATRS